MGNSSSNVPQDQQQEQIPSRYNASDATSPREKDDREVVDTYTEKISQRKSKTRVVAKSNDDVREVEQNDISKQVYQVSSDIVKDRMQAENKEDVKLLENIDKNEVLVVKGSSDQIENVLSAIGVPHVTVQPTELHNIKLTPDKTIYINCHTSGYDASVISKMRKFVEEGGQLITTDWTLNTLLQQAFPGTVVYKGANTSDGVVPITCADDDDEVLKGFRGEEIWKLCGGAHPITISDPTRVKVLIHSDTLAKQYGGDGAILVRFEYGKGTVYHMISHFALQHNKTSTTTTNNYATNSSSSDTYEADREMEKESYVKKKGASSKTVEAMKNDLRGVSFDSVQNACTTSEFVMRAVVKQKKKF